MSRYEVARVNEVIDRVTRIEQWMIQVTPILRKFAEVRNEAWWARFVEDVPYPPILPNIQPLRYVDVTPEAPEDEEDEYDETVVDAFERFSTGNPPDVGPRRRNG